MDLPAEGWNIVRDVETLSGSHNHCEILIEDLRVHQDQMLGGEGQGHLLGQYRLGPARLAHCMRWIGQAETALEMMVDRSLNRYAHGSLKLMVLHAASLIDASGNDPSVVDFRPEVSMAEHFVANSLWRTIDRAIQVHDLGLEGQRDGQERHRQAPTVRAGGSPPQTRTGPAPRCRARPVVAGGAAHRIGRYTRWWASFR